jgi:hypothetical protein
LDEEKPAHVLAMTPESIGKQIDEFLKKLEPLIKNPLKEVEIKQTILCKETRVALEYLENIRTFLDLIDELTERLKPYGKHYPTLAIFNDHFQDSCAQSIKEMKVQSLNILGSKKMYIFFN